MRRRILPVVCLASMGMLVSCTTKEYCTPGKVRVFFVGFDSSEVRSVLVKRYAQGSGPAQLPDSTVYDMPFAASHGYFSQHGDTLNSSWELIGPGADYSITARPANRTWAITNVAFDATYYHSKATGKSSPSQCPITEYTVDGLRQADRVPDGGIIYLRR